MSPAQIIQIQANYSCNRVEHVGLAVSFTVTTGVTWLVSSVTNPLVGAAYIVAAGLVSVLVAKILVALPQSIREKFNDNDLWAVLIAKSFVVIVLLPIFATALGYPIAIPLALLLNGVSYAAEFAAGYAMAKFCPILIR